MVMIKKKINSLTNNLLMSVDWAFLNFDSNKQKSYQQIYLTASEIDKLAKIRQKKFSTHFQYKIHSKIWMHFFKKNIKNFRKINLLSCAAF